ncbi:MAG: hypothetical protein QOG82_97 [Actinomycetota bacterium]|nr:hypothetical protein [Actinomycetota bacterium]
MRGRVLITSVLATLLLAGLTAVIGVAPAAADGVPLAGGHVLVAVGNGKIRHFDASGRLLDTLDTGAKGESGGVLVDGTGALFAVNFAANSVTRFDRSGTKIGPFGQQYDTHPETILRSADGGIYVGLNDGSRQLRRLDAGGVVRARFQPAPENRGVDWADLSPDQCTLLYTSEGKLVKQFNVCSNVQLPDFATLPIAGDNTTNPTTSAYGLRILPSGEVLVAAAASVYRLSPAGVVVRTYTVPRTSQLLTVTLDSDLATFWVGDLPTGRVARVELATGAVVSVLETDPVVGLGGVAVVGEVVAAQPLLRLDPVPPQVVGQPVTVTGTLVNVVKPETTAVRFTVAGANPQAGVATVDPSGRVTLSYVGRNVGTDTITVTAGAATPPVTVTSSVPAVAWSTVPNGTLVYSGATTGAPGQPAYLAARLTDGGNLPVPAVPIVFVVDGAAGCTATTDGAGVATCPFTPQGDPRPVTVHADFPGNGRLAPVRATSLLAVVPPTSPPAVPTAVTLSGPSSAIQGEVTRLTARVVDSRTNVGVGNVAVTFVVNAVETCVAATDVGGTATCLLTSRQPAGRYPLTVSTAAGPGVLASSTAGQLVVTVPAGPVAGGRAVVLTSVGPLLAGLDLSDTGRVASDGASTTTRSLLSVPGPPVALGVADAAVATVPGGASARAAVVNLELALGVVPTITVKAVETTARSTCAEGSAGAVRVASVAVGPITLFTSDLQVPPNTGITVPATGLTPRITLILNEQVVVNGAAGSSVTVNAVHLVIPGLADITVAQASTDVRNCPKLPGPPAR